MGMLRGRWVRSESMYKYVLTIIGALLLPSCDALTIAPYKDDIYGIAEVEETGNISEKLIKCSEDVSCPEYGDALFWIAADVISEASTENIDNMSDFFESVADVSTQQYDFGDPNIKRGIELMNRSFENGNIYAANELGLMYIDQLSIQDFKLARKYLQYGLDNGDMFSAYNLARLSRMEDPNNHLEMLRYLKIAARSQQENFETLFMLGLQEFGTELQQLRAQQYFEENKSVSDRTRSEFAEHFGLSDDE